MGAQTGKVKGEVEAAVRAAKLTPSESEAQAALGFWRVAVDDLEMTSDLRARLLTRVRELEAPPLVADADARACIIAALGQLGGTA